MMVGAPDDKILYYWEDLQPGSERDLGTISPT